MTSTAISTIELTKKLPLLRPGQIIEGRIIEIGKNIVFVDLGPYKLGVILGREIKENKEIIKQLKPNDTLSVMILEPENDDGYVELSFKDAYLKKSWDVLRAFKDGDAVLKAKVLQANRGGLVIEAKGTKGFLPTSQLSSQNFPYVENADPIKIVNRLNKLVGQELDVKIIDLDSHEEKLIVSEKAIEEGKIKNLLTAYQVGEVVEGEVSNVVDFGAFVKIPLKGEIAAEASGLNSIDGLIYISELDWQLISDPRQVIKVGEKIKAKVIGVEGGKLSLSLKALKPDPWQGLEKKYSKGDTIKAKVARLNPFGAFIEVEKNIIGLIHISEFGSFEKMKEALKPDQIYSFKINFLDPQSHKITLGLA